MSTTDNISVAFVQQYSDNIIQLAQQKGSVLRNTVMNKSVVGRNANFDRIGATVAHKKVARHGPTPISDVPHSRRRVYLEDFEWASLIDTNDELKTLIDPKSSYVTAGGMSLGRSMDDEIIAASTGNSTAVGVAESESSVALPAKQKILKDFGAADSNLTIEKLIEARRILMANDIDMSEELTFVVNASALMNGLMQENEIQSFDYNTVKALVRGDIDTFMGFNFVRTERLLGGDSTPVLCLAYAKSAIGLALGKDISSRVSERDDLSYSWQAFTNMTIGAVRVEEEKVVSIECAQ